MNQFECVARIVERDILRYTPAGIPIVSGKLHHVSEQSEAGLQRVAEFELPMIAAGEIAGRFSQASLESSYRFTGFLARKSRNSKSLVFHLVEFEAESSDKQ